MAIKDGIRGGCSTIGSGVLVLARLDDNHPLAHSVCSKIPVDKADDEDLGSGCRGFNSYLLGANLMVVKNLDFERIPGRVGSYAVEEFERRCVEACCWSAYSFRTYYIDLKI